MGVMGNKPWDHRVFDLKVFDSAQSFMSQFREGLLMLLRREDVTESQVVLVANNAIATEDYGLFRLAMATAEALRHPWTEASDDRRILDYLSSHPDPMSVIRRRRTEAGFLLVHNELRKHRPRREADVRLKSIWKEFDPEVFNFNAITTERFASAHLVSGRVDLYYNKFPYYGWHVLCVPVPEGNYPQYLKVGYVALWQELYHTASLVMPGVVMGYNSLEAGASINHLHFHMIVGSEALIMPSRIDGGFGRSVFGQRESWSQINEVQLIDRPFNLVQDRVGLVILRQHGFSLPGPSWSTGFAWFEMAGGYVVTCLDGFESITDEEIWASIRKLAVMG